nr:S6 family peptidase [Haemophilus haemolyticus]
MKKTVFRLNFLTACISLGIVSQAWAGHTYFGIDYQYYRDFAENKGKFTVGAQDIDIYNKKGEMIGTMMKGVPMPDLSSLAKGGYATLVGDQTLISVAHNVGYQDVDFGMTGHNPDQHNFKYKVVKRYNYVNDKDHPYMTDYQHPRLAKFVTEVAPIEMVTNMNGKVYTDLEKYPMRVRVGSGHQYWKDDNNETNGDLAYGGTWLTGGNTFMDGGTGDGHLYLNGRVQNPNDYGPLPIAGAQGDSGSPFFIYDKVKGKWFLNGVLREGHPTAAVGNGYQIARQDYLEEVLEQDLAARFFLNNANYILKTTQDGNGTITQNGRRTQTIGLYNSALPFDSRGGNNGDESPTYKGPNPWSPALHHGKNIYLGDMGKGTLTIENTVNQGAGGLYFEGDFAVKPSDNNVTWQGAGVSVGEESTVEWQVHNPEGDRLSKIGLGTLLVNGKGKNLGSLSVGNGLVVLDQQADEAGQKQAFKEVGIVSGRATVKLNSENQVDPNNIYFGFRGGRLDLNGHSLTFKRIQNTDEGAMIVNHNATTESTVTITGSDTINNNTGDLTNKRDIAFNGWFGDKDDTKNTGRLNVTYNPLNKDNHFLLSGGTNLKGNITQEGGTLVFSGRPTPHAYNHLRRDLSNMEGIPQGEIVWDHDWINRTFKAENFQIKGGQAVVSRNVSAINGNWTINNNASATFGVTPNQENLVCIRSDWTGLTQCKSEKLTNEKTINSLPRTKVNGNVQLSNTASLVASGFVDLIGNVTLTQNSQFTLSHNATQTGSLSLINQANATVNNARLVGNVTLSDSAQFNLANSHFSHQISGTESTTVNLDNANWTMPASATLGDLALNNSEITLNPDFVTQANNSQFNTLTINGNLSGNGIFNYRTYLNQYLGDKLQINGRAQGDFKLNVHNTGAEPTTLEQLTLVTLKQAVDSGLNFTLANQHVDAGTWRYELIKKGNEYRLYNPIKEQELTQNLTNEAQKLSELLAKKTALTEKRYAQEEKVRSKRSVLSEALPDQSYLNTLKTELAALQRNQNAAQEVQNQKEMALTQAQSTVQAAQEKAQTATNAYESAKSLETAQALDEANIALATALVKKEEAQIEFATAKLTQLNLAKQQQEKALAVAEEEKVLSEKGASLQAEKQAFYFMVLSLEEVKEELIITEELLRQAQANNAELKAKKALLERDLEEQANQNKEAQTFKTNLAETLQEKATAAQEKAKAAEQNNSSLSDLNQANQAVIAKQQAVENLKNSTNVQAQALTAEQAKVEQDKTQAEHHKANAQQRQTVEQTMPVTAQFRQEEEKRIAEEKRLVEEAKHQAEEKHLAEEAKRQTEEKRLAEIVNHRKQKELISRYSNSALSELSATVNSMLSVQDELDRLFLSQTQPAVWTNIAQDNRRYDSNAFRAYQQKTNLRQIGGQKVLGDGRIGAVFSHSRSNNTFDEQVKNHATLTMVSGFAQYQWGNLQFGVNVGTGISSSKMAAEQSRKIHRKVMNYGANASYQFRLGQLGVQPYLGMNRYFIERENYQSEEVKVQTPSLTFNRYNAGVRVDYTFAPTNNISIKPYFSVNYVDVSNANTQTIVNSTTLQQPFGRYWQKEVGLNTEILHFQLSTFISQSQGSQLGKQRNMGVKLGYHW